MNRTHRNPSPVATAVAFGLVALLTMSALLFIPAGRLDLPWVWSYIGAWALFMALANVRLAVRHPELSRERRKPPDDRDRATRRLAALPGLGHWVIAGLDLRFGWSSIGWFGHAFGLSLVLVGMLIIAWTFETNTYASSAVRVQHERAQRVVTTGPYALVRHPMYLGVLLISLAGGPALGSWWAMLVISPLVPIFVRRTLVEEHLLRDGLPGYVAYTQKTRWRIVPGLF